MAKNMIESAIRNVANNKLQGKYNLAQYKEGAYKMSEFEKGYKHFRGEEVEMVAKMGRAYYDYNEQKSKMSDVAIRLIMRYYERVSHDFERFLVDLNNSKVLGKNLGSREMKYEDLCKNLNIPIKEKAEDAKLAEVA